MEMFVVQSENNGLFILVGEIHCHPTAKTLYKAGEQVIVEISGTQAAVKDKPTANAYSETWQAVLPKPKPKPKPLYIEKELVWQDLIEKEIYFIPLLVTIMFCSFTFSWFLS